MRYAMAIDLDRCKDHNAEPRGIWWNRVFAPGAPEYGTSVIVDGMPRMEFLPISCQHCENAPCQQVCPTGATYTDDTGTVLVDYEKCIGCRNCVLACPYGAVEIVTEKLPPEPEPTPEEAAAADAAAKDDKTAKGSRARARAKKRKRTRSTVVKCDLCTGCAGGPACAKACPTDALRLIDADFMERARQSKRKAAARATASFASMKLNASLDEGE